jgi:hypothetical protein
MINDSIVQERSISGIFRTSDVPGEIRTGDIRNAKTFADHPLSFHAFHVVPVEQKYVFRMDSGFRL